MPSLRLLQAQAEAKAIQSLGEAQPAAIEAQAEMLKINPDLAGLRKPERWDAKLPISIYGTGSIPFLSRP